jgi:hypothetical protein
MISSKAVKARLVSPNQILRLGRAAAPVCHPVGLRLVAAGQQPRHFSTTPTAHLRDFFPAKETGYIRQTPPAWPHPGYTEQEILAVVPEHRKTETVSDWLAWKLVRVCRCVPLSNLPRLRKLRLTLDQMGNGLCNRRPGQAAGGQEEPNDCSRCRATD